MSGQQIGADTSMPWNKGSSIGQKLPLKLKEIWAIRIRLQLANDRRSGLVQSGD